MKPCRHVSPEGAQGWSTDLTGSALRCSKSTFATRGTRERSPPAASGCGAAEPLAATDILPTGQPKLRRFNIRSKRIQTRKDVLHPLKTVACFFDFSNGLYFFFSSLFQTKPDGSIRMLYSSLAKRFPMLPDNSSPMVPNRPAINNPQNTAASPCLHAPPVPSPQPFRRSSATTHTRAYLGVLNITQRGRGGLTQACTAGTSSSAHKPRRRRSTAGLGSGERHGRGARRGRRLQDERSLGLLARAAGRNSKSPEARKETWKAGEAVWGFLRGRSGHGRARLQWGRVSHPHTGAELSPGTVRIPKGWGALLLLGRFSSPKNTTDQYY